MKPDLGRLFDPRHIAVLGASPNHVPGRYDYIDWHIRSGFAGALYPVNPRYGEVKGLRCYPSLKDIPGEVDMAISMIPAERTVDLLRDTPAGKVHFLSVIASGFSEIGASALERELVSVARARGIRVVGPNCLGIYSRKKGLVQIPDQPFGSDTGEIAVIGQSGGMSVNLVRACINSGVSVNCGASVGNQADLCIEDFLEWFSADEDIKVIAAYVEDVKRSREFVRMVKETTPRKPVILWKGGVTPEGSQAASSHTGALAVPKGVWEGLVRQAGILPADNAFEAVNLARACLWETLPKGPGVGLISPGGGTSVVMTDCSVSGGLDVPVLSPSTRSALSRFIARVNTIIDNPVDLGAASYVPKTVSKTIATMAEDDGVHSFLFYLSVYPYKNVGAREMCREYLSAISEVRREIDKPVYVALYCAFQNLPEVDEARREAVGHLNDLRIPYAMDQESCVKMIKGVSDYSRYLQRSMG
jgi:acyl-CoA synthetase (NDP forming)